jgi:hypothetical protein
VGFCEDGNELSGYMKFGNSLSRKVNTSFSSMALHSGTGYVYSLSISN